MPCLPIFSTGMQNAENRGICHKTAIQDNIENGRSFFSQSCEYDDMSPHLHQLDGVPPHKPWFHACSFLLSWQKSYPWERPTILKTRGYTSQRFLLSCQSDLHHQQMAHWQKQGGQDYIILATIIVANKQSQHIKTVVRCCFVQI